MRFTMGSFGGFKILDYVLEWSTKASPVPTVYLFVSFILKYVTMPLCATQLLRVRIRVPFWILSVSLCIPSVSYYPTVLGFPGYQKIDECVMVSCLDFHTNTIPLNVSRHSSSSPNHGVSECCVCQKSHCYSQNIHWILDILLYCAFWTATGTLKDYTAPL